MALERRVAVKYSAEAEGDEELLKKQASALEDLQENADKAGPAFEKMGNQISRGAGGAQRSVEGAKAALDAYRESLVAAESAGAVIGEAELANLAKLEGEYQQAVDSVGQFRAAQQQAKRDIQDATEAAGGQAERITSLGDIMRKIAEDLGPQTTKWLSWGVAAAGAFKVGYEGGLKFKELLDELSDGKYSAGIQRDLTNWLRLDQGINTVAEDAELLKNQLNILRNEGIDPTGLSAEQVAAKVLEIGKAMQKTSIEVAAAAAGFKEYAKEQKAMIDGLAAQIEALKGLSGKELADQMRLLPAAIKEALDSLQQIVDAGGTIPPELQKIADAWGVVSTAAEESAQRHVEVVRQIMSDIKGELVKTRPELEAEAKALAQAIPDAFANMPPIQFLDAQQFENAQVVFRQMINTLVAGGEAIPPALEAAARAVGVFNDAVAGVNMQPAIEGWNRAIEILKQLNALTERVGTSLKRVFSDPLAQGDTQIEELDPGDGGWSWQYE